MKQKILFFTDWYPPAYKAGGPIVSVYNLTQALKAEFDILVLAGSKDLGCEKRLEGIETGKELIVDGVKVFYKDSELINRKFLRRIFNDFSPNFIWLSGLFSPKFSILPILLFNKTCKTVVSPRGMLHESALKLKPLKKRLFINFLKFSGIQKKIVWHATNRLEKQFIEDQFGKNINCFIAANLARGFNENLQFTHKVNQELRLLVLGRIAEEKNSLFALQVLEFSKNKDIVVDFYGNKGTDSYSKQFQRHLDKLKQAGYKVEYKGSVSPISLTKNVFPNYHFMYLPTNGENFGHAISDSLAHSTPVVISDKTPWNDLSSHGCYVLKNEMHLQADVLNELYMQSAEEYNSKVYSAINYYKAYCASNLETKKYIDFIKFESFES